MPRSLFSNTVRAALYDPVTNTSTTKKISFPKQTKGLLFKPFLDRMIELKGKYYFILRSWDPNRKVSILLSWEFTPATLAISEEPLEIMSVPYEKGAYGSIMYSVNKEKGKIFMLGGDGGKTGSEHWVVRILDESLKLLFENGYDAPYDRTRLTIDDFSVLDDESLVVSCSLKPAVYSYKNPGQTEAIFFTLPKGAPKAIETKPDLKGNSAFESHFIWDGESLFAYGLVSNFNRVESPTGVFLIQFDVHGKIRVPSTVRNFPKETIAHARLHKYDVAITNLQMLNVFTRKDGGYQFITEVTENNPFPTTQQMVAYRTVGNTTYKETTTITYGPYLYTHHAVVFSIFPDSTKDWFTVLRKMQTSNEVPTRQYLSFARIFDDQGNLHIIYNDSDDNLNKTEAEEPDWRPGSDKKSMAVHAIISPDGKLRKKLLYKYEDMPFKVRIPSVEFRPDRTFNFVALGKKTYRVGVGKLD
jgi:hypothetical protein